MRTKITKLVLTFLISGICYLNSNAQKQGNIWKFGYGIGLDFNNGTPTLITDSKAVVTNQLWVQEATSSISDSKGNLLFYVFGNSSTMNGGSYNLQLKNGLNETVATLTTTNESAAQGVVIIPKPGSLNQYYLITTDALYSPNVSYNNGSKKGVNFYTVTALSPSNVSVSGATKLKAYPNSECLSACPHSNGIDYWVVSHDSTTGFNAWQFNNSGPQTPQFSTISSINFGGIEKSAFIKFNSCFTKLAIVQNGGIPYICDFDNSTGKISNPIAVPNVTNAYCLEFSDNGKYLYISQNEVTDAGIFQYNLSSNTTIKLSGTFPQYIGTGSNAYGGQIQLGPDGNIYSSNFITFNGYDGSQQSYIGQISNADLSTASWNPKYIAIKNNNGQLITSMGLPNLLKSFVASKPKIQINGSNSSSKTVCVGNTISLGVLQNGEIKTGGNWNFNGTIINNRDNFINTFNVNGKNPINVSIVNNCGISQTIFDTIVVLPYQVANATENLSNCSKPVLIGSGSLSGNYKWFDKDPNLSGANLLNIGSTFTASPNSTYYVQPTGISNPPIGNSKTSFDFANSGEYTSFTVFSSTYLYSVNVIPTSYSTCSGNVTWKLTSGSSTGTIIASGSIPSPASSCNVATPIYINKNLSSGTYYLVYTGGNRVYDGGTYNSANTSISGVVTITGGVKFASPYNGPFSSFVFVDEILCSIASLVKTTCCTPSINQPVAQTVCTTQPVTITGGVNGNGKILRWEKTLTANDTISTAKIIKLSSETNSSYTKLSTSLLDNGTYYRYVVSSGSDTLCRANSKWVLLTVENCVTGVENNNIENITFSPNPVNNLLYFNSTIIGKILVSDIDGRSILNESINASSIDLSSLKSGIYIFKIIKEDNLFYFKVIKE